MRGRAEQGGSRKAKPGVERIHNRTPARTEGWHHGKGGHKGVCPSFGTTEMWRWGYRKGSAEGAHVGTHTHAHTHIQLSTGITVLSLLSKFTTAPILYR